MSTVAALWRYPVKSMLGEALDSVEITTGGVAGDRALALVDEETGKVVSAKNPLKWPNLFAYRAATAEGGVIVVTLPDGQSVRSDSADAAARISAALGRRIAIRSVAPAAPQLEQFWPEHEGQANEVSQEAVAGDAPAGSFFDYSALHILTTATLAALQKVYPQGTIDARRFRPNLVIETAGEGFVENDWVGKTLKIGAARFAISDPCPRCVMPTLAQEELPRDPVCSSRPSPPTSRMSPSPAARCRASASTPGWSNRASCAAATAPSSAEGADRSGRRGNPRLPPMAGRSPALGR